MDAGSRSRLAPPRQGGPAPRRRGRSRRIVEVNGMATAKRTVRIAFARCWVTGTTTGNQAGAAPCPKAPWPNANQPAIPVPSPRSTAAR
jgi:hypothetical protein